MKIDRVKKSRKFLICARRPRKLQKYDLVFFFLIQLRAPTWKHLREYEKKKAEKKRKNGGKTAAAPDEIFLAVFTLPPSRPFESSRSSLRGNERTTTTTQLAFLLACSFIFAFWPVSSVALRHRYWGGTDYSSGTVAPDGLLGTDALVFFLPAATVVRKLLWKSCCCFQDGRD